MEDERRVRQKVMHNAGVGPDTPSDPFNTEMTEEDVDSLVASIPEPEVASVKALAAWAGTVKPRQCFYVTDAVSRFHGPTAESVAQGIMDKLLSEELMNAGMQHGYRPAEGVDIPDGVFHHLIDERASFSM